MWFVFNNEWNSLIWTSWKLSYRLMRSACCGTQSIHTKNLAVMCLQWGSIDVQNLIHHRSRSSFISCINFCRRHWFYTVDNLKPIDSDWKLACPYSLVTHSFVQVIEWGIILGNVHVLPLRTEYTLLRYNRWGDGTSPGTLVVKTIAWPLVVRREVDGVSMTAQLLSFQYKCRSGRATRLPSNYSVNTRLQMLQRCSYAWQLVILECDRPYGREV